MSWYPGSCNNDKSESVEVHVSCRQIAPKYKPCDARLSITGNKLLNFALTLCIFNVSIKNSFWLFWNIDWTSDKSTYREWQKFVISCSESTKVDSTWLKFVRNVPIDNKSELAEVLPWCWTDDKPLTAPMMTQFDDAYMPHPTSMSPSVETKLDCELSDTNYFDHDCVSVRLSISPPNSCLRKGCSGSKLLGHHLANQCGYNI